MLVELEEAKNYLRVDSLDDDGLILDLIQTSENLITDICRVPSSVLVSFGNVVKTADLYAIGYLYEHRDEADHKELILMLKNLLFGIREEVF